MNARWILAKPSTASGGPDRRGTEHTAHVRHKAQEELGIVRSGTDRTVVTDEVHEAVHHVSDRVEVLLPAVDCSRDRFVDGLNRCWIERIGHCRQFREHLGGNGLGHVDGTGGH